MAPILAAADEEGLDAHRPALAGEREHVGVAEPLGVDRLAALDEGQRAQPVAEDRGELEIHRLGRLGHQPPELLLDLGRLAAEEVLRVADQLGIAGFVDAADAGRRAAADLVEQAGPRAVGEEAVGAAPQQEQFLQRVERRADRAGAGERAVILALVPPRAAMELDAREVMVLAQQDEGEAFVVAQQHVVGRPVALDQLRLEQQRLGLAVGGDDLHRRGSARPSAAAAWSGARPGCSWLTRLFSARALPT